MTFDTTSAVAPLPEVFYSFSTKIWLCKTMVFYVNWDDNGMGFLFSGWVIAHRLIITPPLPLHYILFCPATLYTNVALSTRKNCFFPCPYMTDDNFPSTFRWQQIEERGIKQNRQVIVAVKEPGPGFVGCLFMLLPPALFAVPCFLWKATAISMTFTKKKNDHVDCDYREKHLCTEKKVMLYSVISSSVQNYEVKLNNGTSETVYIICIKHSGGVFEFKDIALANNRWKENANSLCNAINSLVTSRPF